MVRVKVFTQHPCATFFPALNLNSLGLWNGWACHFTVKENAERERLVSRELLSERGTMRNERWCLFFSNLLHTTRAVTRPRSIQSKHAGIDRWGVASPRSAVQAALTQRGRLNWAWRSSDISTQQRETPPTSGQTTLSLKLFFILEETCPWSL